MKVFLDVHTQLSRAMDRVVHALKENTPSNVTIVGRVELADLVVLHVIGYPETVAAIEQIQRRGQRYAMIQYCVRTTQRPCTADWISLWRNAEVVWSYYDLEQLCREDEQRLDCEFLHTPLGVDTRVFYPVRELPCVYEIATSGYVADTEGISEAAEACKRLRRQQFHLGPDLNLGSHVTYRLGINDGDLARMYSRCRFVAGLRRIEGFELPAAEGLLCGARPIMFDQPHYRSWFGDLAEYVPEGPFNEVLDALTAIFEAGPRPVTTGERQLAAASFDWRRITTEFWKCVGARVTA